jgi:hypothetical protein
MKTEMVPFWDLEDSRLEYLDICGSDIEVLAGIQDAIDLGGCGFDLLIKIKGRYKLMVSCDYDYLCGANDE